MKAYVPHAQSISKTGQLRRFQRRISRKITAFALCGKVLEYREIQKKNLTRVFKMGKFHKRAFMSVLS